MIGVAADLILAGTGDAWCDFARFFRPGRYEFVRRGRESPVAVLRPLETWSPCVGAAAER